MKKNQGFTLIELMIVIAIIAILMAYALPAYRDYTIRTKLGEGNAMAAAVKMAVNEAYVRNGTLTGLDSGSNGIPAAGANLGQCVNSMTTTAGVIVVTFDCNGGSAGAADSVVDAATVTWTPNTVTNGGLQWTCSSTGTTAGQDPC